MTLESVPPYDATRPSNRGEHAVVVGASMAGLLAGRVLVDHFDEVTVIDRDALPEEPTVRAGVPQSTHVHVLLEAGRLTLDDLFPGYCDELRAAGAPVIDGARDVNFHAEGDFFAEGPERIDLYCATRPVYEALARRRLGALDGVRLRERCQYTDFRSGDGGATVEGVAVRNEDGEHEDLAADLVVDTTGRTSRTPAWLERHGYARPRTDEVHVDLAYSTAYVERPADDRRAFLVAPSPSCPRGSGVLPVEDDRWVVTLYGFHGDHPPTDREDLVDFAGGLPVPHVRRLLARRAWTSADVAHYPFPASLRRRYEALDRFPTGLVVLGDAVASFNPTYAQGMSVAALEALALHHALGSAGREDLAARFFERAAAIVDDAWLIAVGSDFRFPRTTGPRLRGVGLSNRYLARLSRRAHTDGTLRDAYFRVLVMERPPRSLFRPGVAWRVLKPTG